MGDAHSSTSWSYCEVIPDHGLRICSISWGMKRGRSGGKRPRAGEEQGQRRTLSTQSRGKETQVHLLTSSSQAPRGQTWKVTDPSGGHTLCEGQP